MRNKYILLFLSLLVCATLTMSFSSCTGSTTTTTTTATLTTTATAAPITTTVKGETTLTTTATAAPITTTTTSTIPPITTTVTSATTLTTTSTVPVISATTLTTTATAPPITTTVISGGLAQEITRTVTSTPPPVTSTVTSTTILVKAPVTLNIAAASSLTNVLNKLNVLYVQQNPWVTITPNYAASGTLQTQISNGAPADIFFSAAEAQMNTLQNQNLLLANSRKDLLNNSIVLIVPSDSTLSIHSFSDLDNLIKNGTVKHVAIGDPASVPAGAYATLAFNELGITADVQSVQVLCANVTQVLQYVESGNVDAGVVYWTDALSAPTQVTVVAYGPADVNAQITYPIAIINTTKVADTAADYINFLSTTSSAAIFKQYGFNVLGQ